MCCCRQSPASLMLSLSTGCGWGSCTGCIQRMGADALGLPRATKTDAWDACAFCLLLLHIKGDNFERSGTFATNSSLQLCFHTSTFLVWATIQPARSRCVTARGIREA